MAINFKDLKGLAIKAKDGEIGKVKDLLFDDRSWVIHYVVVDTGGWLSDKKVLISTLSFANLSDKRDGELNCNLSKKQIEDSPVLEAGEPISRQHESKLHAYYGWAPYWGIAKPLMYPYRDAPFTWIKGMNTHTHSQIEWTAIESEPNKAFNGHLRSLDEVNGYKIGTIDDKEFGEVSDVMIDINDWLIIDLILSSKKWMSGGKEFVCSPMFVKSLDERSKVIYLDQTKQDLLEGPDFDRSTYGEKYRKSLVHHYYNSTGTKI